MPKYLIQASYTSDGIKGLIKDKASGRRAATTKTIESVGGKVEALYFAFGADDVVGICDLPDNVTAAAIAVGVASTGLVNVRTTPLLTVEEVDQALKKVVQYRAPGQ